MFRQNSEVPIGKKLESLLSSEVITVTGLLLQSGGHSR